MGTGKWLTILGLGEDGPDGLTPASRATLDRAEIVMGPPRHLALLPDVSARTVEWPVPFADGLPTLMSFRGRQVVVLASGDPFWFGAGSVLARQLDMGEWAAHPGPSIFSLAASRLGWPLESTVCLGLHAAPLARLRPHLSPGVRAIVTLRDGGSGKDLAAWLCDERFGASQLHVLEALGGPQERVRQVSAEAYAYDDVVHPVAVALTCAGDGEVIHRASGQVDAFFDHDGQITKQPVRAVTLAALAPRPGERLWDIGAGSGSIALEWLMSASSTKALAIEARTDRAERIRQNAERLGQDRLEVVEGRAPDALAELPEPHVVFVGGGLMGGTLAWLETNLAPGTRVVANAVTLETEALLIEAASRLGGRLIKLDLSEAQPLGRFRGWKASYPLVQWSVTL